MRILHVSIHLDQVWSCQDVVISRKLITSRSKLYDSSYFIFLITTCSIPYRNEDNRDKNNIIAYLDRNKCKILGSKELFLRQMCLQPLPTLKFAFCCSLGFVICVEQIVNKYSMISDSVQSRGIELSNPFNGLKFKLKIINNIDIINNSYLSFSIT